MEGDPITSIWRGPNYLPIRRYLQGGAVANTSRTEATREFVELFCPRIDPGAGAIREFIELSWVEKISRKMVSERAEESGRVGVTTSVVRDSQAGSKSSDRGGLRRATREFVELAPRKQTFQKKNSKFFGGSLQPYSSFFLSFPGSLCSHICIFSKFFGGSLQSNLFNFF